MKNVPLIKARKKCHLTQKGLATMLGYSKATVSNWENGYSNPTLSDAFKISAILREDLKDLFSGLLVQELCT